MPGNHATGTLGILSSSELDRDTAGLQGTYGWAVQSGAVTFTSGLTFAVAAVAAGDYTVNSVLGAVYAGGSVVLGTQDATLPRVDIIVITSAGAVSAVAGTPKALTSTSGPVPTAPSSSQLEIARIFVPASGTALTSANITDRRVALPVPTPISANAQKFIEGAVYKNYFQSGGGLPNGISASSAGTTLYMVGDMYPFTDQTSTVSGAGTASENGAVALATSSNTGANALLQGPGRTSAQDWTLCARVKMAAGVTRTMIIGCKANITAVDENGMIAFRVQNTGNIIGVCDNAGTETARDSGVTIATERALRIEVRSGGTIVRFYVDGVQVGADVTTNIPTTTNLKTIVGHSVQDNLGVTAYVWDVSGWCEV